MGQPALRVGVVDIGTNSMRLLIVDGEDELGRWVEITGLGRGVDATGRLSPDAVEETLEVLEGFGSLMDRHGVERRTAIATSASRDAVNREELFDAVTRAIGVRPRLISGEEEARFAYAGATAGLDVAAPVVVSDIGGGSTELVTEHRARSVDVGSVRLTERHLAHRPPPREELETARDVLRKELFRAGLGVSPATHIGVAGTWTSLSAIAQELPAYDRERVHCHRLTRDALTDVVARLSKLTVDETRAIPALDPRRAPVILAGGLIAQTVMETLDVGVTVVSERDTLDGVAMTMVGIP